MGPAAPLDGGGRVGTAVVPRGGKLGGQAVEAPARQFGDKGAAVAEMAVRRGGTDPGRTGEFGEGKAAQTALGDQTQRRLDQRLTQVAVMVALAGERHVTGIYITGGAGDRPTAPGCAKGAGRLMMVTDT